MRDSVQCGPLADCMGRIPVILSPQQQAVSGGGARLVKNVLRPRTSFWTQVREVRTLRSFQFREYRFLWSGTVLWSLGSWMQRIATAWLVLELTESPVYVALAYALYFMPSFVVALFAGTVADQVDRRKLMMAILVMNVVASLVLTILVMAEVAQLWSILLIVAIIGVGIAFKIPTSQTMAFDVVGPETVLNAVSLQSVGMRAVGVLGAVTGGALIETVGMPYAFLAATLSYTFGLIMISLLRYTPRSRPESRGPLAANLVEGLKIFTRSRPLATVLLMALLAESFGLGALAMLPVLAAEGVLGVGPDGLGIMQGAVGVGGGIAAIAIASFSSVGRKGRLVLVAFLCYGIVTILVGQSSVFALTVLLLCCFGLAQSTFDTMQIVILQQNVPDDMRGRAMGGWLVCVGVGPFGSLLLGYLTELFSVQQAIGMGGSLIVVVALVLVVTASRVRAIE